MMILELISGHALISLFFLLKNLISYFCSTAGVIFVQMGPLYKRKNSLRWKERITKCEEDTKSSKTEEQNNQTLAKEKINIIVSQSLNVSVK